MKEGEWDGEFERMAHCDMLLLENLPSNCEANARVSKQGQVRCLSRCGKFDQACARRDREKAKRVQGAKHTMTLAGTCQSERKE